MKKLDYLIELDKLIKKKKYKDSQIFIINLKTQWMNEVKVTICKSTDSTNTPGVLWDFGTM